MRVVFTVALLVAVAGVVVPAVEYAGVQRSDTTVRDAVDRLVGEARALERGNDALASDAGPARHAVSLSLPADGFASARVEQLTVGPPRNTTADADRDATAPDATRFAWRVDGGTAHTVVAEGVRIRPGTGRTLTLGPGRVRLHLTLVAVSDARGSVVRVQREG